MTTRGYTRDMGELAGELMQRQLLGTILSCIVEYNMLQPQPMQDP